MAGLGLAPARIQNHDGPMSGVLVTTERDRRALSPGAACGPEDYDQIVVGFPQLEASFDAL